jgi:hypothetical protein
MYEGEKEFYIRRGKKKGELFLTEVKFLFPPRIHQTPEREIKMSERKDTFSMTDSYNLFSGFQKE